MKAVTEAFEREISGSHLIAVRATVLPSETVLETVVEGSVNLDANATTRGSLDLTVVDDGTLIPETPADLLAPYGNEIQIERGVTYADGSVEMVSLGIFRIETVEVSDTGVAADIRISGLDRSVRIIDAIFEVPGQVNAGTTVTDAITSVVEDADIDVRMAFETVEYLLPKLTWEEGGDRWEFLQKIAELSGTELYFDGNGILVLRTIPSPNDKPAISVSEGEGGVLLSATRRWTREKAANRVIVTGEALKNSAVPRGVATDENGSSPTYFWGPFGKVIKFEKSSIVGSAAQAEAAAQGILDKTLGTFSELSLGVIVNPALEPGDVVRVYREKLGIDESHVLDSLSIPLTVEGAMAAKTRGVVV